MAVAFYVIASINQFLIMKITSSMCNVLAIASYDKALVIQPDYQLAKENRDIALRQLKN